jgi:hypothetical protein
MVLEVVVSDVDSNVLFFSFVDNGAENNVDKLTGGVGVSSVMPMALRTYISARASSRGVHLIY